LVSKLGVIGGGRMAEAFLTAIKESQKMSNVFVYDVNETRLDVLKSKYGIHKAMSVDDVVKDADFVVSKMSAT
jgi:pyrroline-5-carboxylate reductase